MSELGTHDRSITMLPDDVRRLHRALLDAMLATGEVPSASALMAELGIGQDALDKYLQTLIEGDYLAFDRAGRLTCLYPYSADPTSHVVTIDGIHRFAMCSLDALGMAAMLEREVEIESACPVCGAPIRLAVRPGVIANVEPPSMMVVARRDGDSPAFEACCGFTVFTCNADHADVLIAQTSSTSALALDAALAVGETLFADLLDDTLPGKRKRASAHLKGT
jgi:alkylmercury lyase